MSIVRLLSYMLLGVFLSMLEWTLFNISSGLFVLKIGFICVMVLFVRGYFAGAFAAGLGSAVVQDIGSFMFGFPLRMIVFVGVFFVLYAISHRFVRHRSMSGFAVLGGIGFVLMRGVFDIAVALLVRIPISSMHFFWTEVVISFSVFMLIVIIRNQRWRVLKIRNYG